MENQSHTASTIHRRHPIQRLTSAPHHHTPTSPPSQICRSHHQHTKLRSVATTTPSSPPSQNRRYHHQDAEAITEPDPSRQTVYRSTPSPQQTEHAPKQNA
ncbi:hypothetical protein QL285_050950 [Trifolium repens]|nr:hypothetical protein QL285_050950 [Trifolium repens]